MISLNMLSINCFEIVSSRVDAVEKITQIDPTCVSHANDQDAAHTYYNMAAGMQ